MRIDFFEEYPTENTLLRAQTLPQGTMVYLAAHSMKEFGDAKERLALLRPDIEAAYWPVLQKSYWISPFSFPHELETLRTELAAQHEPVTVLLDLELPFLSPKLFIQNIRHFLGNKKRIREILTLAGKGTVRFSTAEYWWTIVLPLLPRFLGIAYDARRLPHTRIIMCYSSMLASWQWRLMQPFLRYGFRQTPSTAMGIGTLATGVLGNEPVLSPERFREDLAFAQSIRRDVVVFRLGGLTEGHAAAIHEADKR